MGVGCTGVAEAEGLCARRLHRHPPACPSSGSGWASALVSLPARTPRARSRSARSNKALAAPSGDSGHYSLASFGVSQGNLGLPVQGPTENWVSWNPEWS